MNKILFGSASIFLAAIICPVQSGLAQTFTPGEIVKCKGYGEEIEVKVLKQDASGVLVLLKDWQDGTFKPGGSSRYYSPAELTRVTANPVGGATGGATGATQQAYTQGQAQVQGQGQGAAQAADLGGSGPLSKQQILDYLTANVGTDGPHPQKDAISAKVVEAIKKRGVNFKASWKDSYSKAGGNTTVGYAVQDNYGAPVQQPWLFGAWELQFTNVSGFFASRDSVAKMGFVSIEPGHTYIWKIHQDDPATAWIEGKWREATPEEMKYQGGAGLVLLDGEQHLDWIVHKDQTSTLPGDWINVADIDSRQMRRGGVRK